MNSTLSVSNSREEAKMPYDGSQLLLKDPLERWRDKTYPFQIRLRFDPIPTDDDERPLGVDVKPLDVPPNRRHWYTMWVNYLDSDGNEYSYGCKGADEEYVQALIEDFVNHRATYSDHPVNALIIETDML